MSTEESKIIDYWVKKINVEQSEDFNRLKREQDEKIREHNRTSSIKIALEPGLFLSEEMMNGVEIPVADYEIIQRNGIVLTGHWSCASGRKAYDERRKMTWFEGGNFPVAFGAPIEGYYKVVGKDERGNFVCYYNEKNYNEFVSEEIRINAHQLGASGNHPDLTLLRVGTVFKVERLDLLNNRYSVTWHIVND